MNIPCAVNCRISGLFCDSAKWGLLILFYFL